MPPGQTYPELDVQTSRLLLLKHISDDPDDPFVALAPTQDTEQPRGQALDCFRLALRAYRNRHLGALTHCCEAWEPVGKCFDQWSFECIDFHGLTQIVASLTRERITEREAEIRDLPWTQTEKDNALAKCRLGLRAWRAKKPMLCLHALTDEDGHPLQKRRRIGQEAM